MENRKCSKCKETKPCSMFHKHRFCKGGINSVCKECRKPLSQKSYKDTSIETLMWQRAKRRAKEKSLPFSISLSDIVVPQYCPILGITLSVGDADAAFSLDRVIPSKGYVAGNVEVISNKANRLKSNASIEDLEKIIRYIKTKEGFCEI